MPDNFRVAGFVTGLAIKAPVNTISLVNVPTPTGVGGSFGGYIVGLYDRVLLAAQTNPIDNGIYSVRESAWIRDGDADGNRDFVGGTIVPVWNQASSTIILYRLEGDADQKTIGLSSLVFTVYYNPGSQGLDTLQTATQAGNTTDQGMIITAGGQMEMPTYRIAALEFTIAANSVVINVNETAACFIDVENATADFAIALSTPSAGAGYYYEMNIDFIQGSGGWNAIWPASVKWPGGSAPALSAADNAEDTVHVYTRDNGVSWKASFLQNYS